MKDMLCFYTEYQTKKTKQTNIRLTNLRIDDKYKELKSLLDDFEVEDPYDEEFNEKLTKIRNSFKVMYSNVNLTYRCWPHY